ncbi:MAG: hypothetical protein ICCCNLDF_02880 [Planctomycetes bacterium]|nr:hypothetical protein [Planctomycetota bacterium]
MFTRLLLERPGVNQSKRQCAAVQFIRIPERPQQERVTTLNGERKYTIRIRSGLRFVPKLFDQSLVETSHVFVVVKCTKTADVGNNFGHSIRIAVADLREI